VPSLRAAECRNGAAGCLLPLGGGLTLDQALGDVVLLRVTTAVAVALAIPLELPLEALERRVEGEPGIGFLECAERKSYA